MRIDVLSSTPADPLAGSGTFVAIDGLSRGLAALGHAVSFRSLRARTGFHTFDRWLYNAAVASSPPRGDLVIGVDLDGFLWAGRRGRPAPRFVVALKGIIADELTHERGWVRRLLAMQARWERLNVEAADRVLVPSRYSAAVAAAAYAIPRAKIRVVPEPIDLTSWHERFAAAERRVAARPVVLAVARMYRRKRLEDLLEAARIVRRRIPEIAVRIAGDGPESARLRAHAVELDLGGTVTFLGDVSRNALAAEYVNAHCFCLPTVQEGFGIVFAEAMAAGLPVVAARAAAVPEVVIDRVTGLLVNPRSPEELAMAIETLLTNEGLRKDMGEAARRRVEELDLRAVASRFLAAAA
jgi:glycosyltransferase involved in cell wall biosynthesis